MPPEPKPDLPIPAPAETVHQRRLKFLLACRDKAEAEREKPPEIRPFPTIPRRPLS